MTTTAYTELAQRYQQASKASEPMPEIDEALPVIQFGGDEWVLDNAGDVARYSAADWQHSPLPRKGASQNRYVNKKTGQVKYFRTRPSDKAKAAAKPGGKTVTVSASPTPGSKPATVKVSASMTPKPKAAHPLDPKRPAQKADDDLFKAIESVIKPKAKAEEAKPVVAKPKAEKPKRKHERPAGKSSAEIEKETEARVEANPEPFIEEYLDPDRYPGKKDPNENVTYGPDGKLVSVALNTDEFRDLFPEYVGTNSGEVHEACSALNKVLFKRMLEQMKGRGNGKMIILAGGGGSGKGSATDKHFAQQEYPIRLDQVTGELNQADKKFKQAIEAGWKQEDFEFCFVDREPADAWNAGVVNRAINLRKKGELARTVALQRDNGSGAYQDNLNARKTALELMKKYPEMTVRIIDNNHGHDQSVLIRDRDKAMQFLEEQIAKHEAAGDIRPQLRDKTLARHDAGEIPEDILRGLLGDKAVDEHLKGKAKPEDPFELPAPESSDPFSLPGEMPEVPPDVKKAAFSPENKAKIEKAASQIDSDGIKKFREMLDAEPKDVSFGERVLGVTRNLLSATLSAAKGVLVGLSLAAATVVGIAIDAFQLSSPAGAGLFVLNGSATVAIWNLILDMAKTKKK